MLDQTDPSALFLDHLAWIERVAAATCQRHALADDDADEFASWVKARLIENDYAVLRKYRGESGFTTYLAAVVTRLFQEYARERTGRWRNSMAAEQLGLLARELEMLVYRDGCSLSEAAERLRSAGRTDLSDVELARLLAKLPLRAPLRPADLGAAPLRHALDSSRADALVSAEEVERQRQALHGALFRAIEALQPEEQMIVRMHLADGRTVADVARALRLDQRALYRRIPRLREQLRRAMEEQGVSAGDVRELIDAATDWDAI